MPDALGHGYATETTLAVRSYAYETTFEHVDYGTMHIWRHPSAEDLK